MDGQGLQHEFVYEGTAQDFFDFLWKLEQNQYGKFTGGERRWAELGPQPKPRRLRDGNPFLVEYIGSRQVTIIDPADGKERTTSEPVPGITFELDPLPYGRTHITARCHNQVFEEWYYYLLELFGIQTSTTESAEPSVALLVSRGAPGRRRDSWNQNAIDRLRAGADEEAVKAVWREDYKAGHYSGEYPDASEEGEYKTWQERVMKPYREIQRTE